ncbi:MAG: DDE-type integrase/transposase/recombinase [Rhodomicrobium sp.]
MQVRLHANAATTPKTRAYIQQSSASVPSLALELGISETTVRRWKNRTTVQDGSHTPKRLAISLTPIEEHLVLELRRSLGLPLDDLTEVMQRCVNAKLSRSSIHRCLQRHGISRPERPAQAKPGRFDAQPFGFVHIDLKHLPRLNKTKAYVFVAIERATRFVHAEIVERRDAQTIAGCFGRFLNAFGHPIHTVLTDNGSEFTDRFAAANWKKENIPTGRHPFDSICKANGIRHRLTRPFKPQTNGMAERFNRRLAEALNNAPPASRNGGKNRFPTHAGRNAFIHAFVHNYNRTRLRCLGYLAPLQALANQTGHNTLASLPRNVTASASGCGGRGNAVAPAAACSLSHGERAGVRGDSFIYHAL